MWVNSKEAAEILGVKYDTLKRAVFRAEKSGKKFCSIKSQICNFEYIDGVGRGGKVLQIWIDERLISTTTPTLNEVAKNRSIKGEIGGTYKVSTKANKDSKGIHGADEINEADAGKLLYNRGGGTCSSSKAWSEEKPSKAWGKTNSSCKAWSGENSSEGFGEANGVAKTDRETGAYEEFRQREAKSKVLYARDRKAGVYKENAEQGVSGGDNMYRSVWTQGKGGVDDGGVDGASSNRRKYNIHEQGLLGGDNTGGSVWTQDKIREINFRLTERMAKFGAVVRSEPYYEICGCGSGTSSSSNSDNSMAWIAKRGSDGRKDTGDSVYKGCGNRLGDDGYGSYDNNGSTCSDKQLSQKIYECEAPKPRSSTITSENAWQSGRVYEVTNDNKLPRIATCSDKKRKIAFEKYGVIQEWKKAKGKIKEAVFIEYINAKKICSIKVTVNKLYDWQRKHAKGGIDGLVDERTNNKKLTLEVLGLDKLCIDLILASRGRVNITNIYKSLNYEAVRGGVISLERFNGKKDEIVSYELVNRFVKNYLEKNKLLKNIILYGEDGAISRGMPALGKSNWAVDSINQIVEIDASPLDLICNASDICESIGYQSVNNVFKSKDEFETYVKEWQKRYTIIALIDTYSGVASFHISDSENSVGIARAVAKYILRYGKPHVIKGDNGKAFKSEYVSSVMSALNIEYRAVRAYSGWLKPYVERNFRELQHNFTANLAGFIGHNITQRQAIEFFYSKKERRLKKGYKTNIRELKNMIEVQELMDMYAEKFLNTRYLERLGMSVAEAYNARAHEAVVMDVISLSARLSKREIKSVNKKGISVDGIWYQNVTMHAYSKVQVNLNINNQSECFLWDESGKFIDVAIAFDEINGTSVETTKASQKLFNKRVKETKVAMQIARKQSEARFESFVRSVEASGATCPKMEAVNGEGMMINRALKVAGGVMKNEAISDEALRAASSDTKKGKKHKGWEHFGAK